MKRFIAFTTIFTAPLADAQKEHGLAEFPPHQTPVPYVGIRNWHLTQNLGATGARGYVQGHEGHSHDSREVMIKSIEPNSPADGILQPYDIIVGAAVPPKTPASSWTTAPELKRFDSDARLAFSRALTWAESEAGKGELKLLRVRNGKQDTVTLKLPVLGTYSDTAPFECTKSAKIVENAAAFIADKMPADGYGPGIGRPHNAGLLLATHNPEYLDHVRRSAMRMSLGHTITDAGHETWRWGNTNTFLTEYYLATGDDRVIPTIEEFAKVLTDGQCNPGTWGHRGVPDFIPPGYGSVNSTGIVCFYSLILGKQAGVTYSDQAIANSVNFYGKYAGRGNIPYGDHTPFYSTSNGGKAGKAALCFFMLDAYPASQWFARLSASSNLKEIESGHTGNYFNQTWTPLGVQLAGRQNTINYWKRFLSYRDMCRRQDGSFMTQPWPQTREGDLGTGCYVNRGPLWTTGSFALSYLVGTERLAMLGRRDSCFAVDAPAELKPALQAFRAKDFKRAIKLADALQSSSNARAVALTAQLIGVCERNLASIPLTLASMEKNLNAGDLYLVKHQLQAIESVLDPNDSALTKYYTALEGEGIEKILTQGAQYHRSLSEMAWDGEKGFNLIQPGYNNRTRRWLQDLTRNQDSFYGRAAATILESNPNRPMRAGKELVVLTAEPGQAPNQSHTVNLEFDVENAGAIRDLYFSYLSAKELKVHLNGTLILDLKIGRPDTRPVTLLLKPITSELLENGKNSITVDFTPADENFKASIRMPQ